MIIEEAIKAMYENLGFAVLEVKAIDGTPLFEIEFIGPTGHCKRPVVTFFMIANPPPQKPGEICAPPF